MNLRETFNEKPGLAAAIAGGLILVGLVLMGVQLRGPSAPAAATRAFFSDDDGKTWFVDDAAKIPPFVHGGKEAVRAYVYRSAKGKEFVNHLERYKPDAKALLEAAARGDKSAGNVAAVQGAHTGGREVKRPGDAKWIPSSKFREASGILSVKSPDGDADPRPIEP